MSIKVIFVDNLSLMRDGLRIFLADCAKDIKIVADADNGKNFLKIAKKTPADVYVLSLYLPDMDSLELLDKLLKQDPARKVIVVTEYCWLPEARSAIRRGAQAYVTMARAKYLVKAIRKVHAGKCFVEPDIAKAAGGRCPCKRWRREKDDQLTLKEHHVLRFAGRGASNEVIGMRLRMTAAAARAHRKRIMKKLDIHKWTDLVRYARREGFTELQLPSVDANREKMAATAPKRRQK